MSPPVRPEILARFEEPLLTNIGRCGTGDNITLELIDATGHFVLSAPFIIQPGCKCSKPRMSQSRLAETLFTADNCTLV